MNADVFRRVAWKEYRALRGLWIMLAALAVVAQLLWVTAQSMLPNTVAYATIWLYGIALVVVALFGLGSAAILFAIEREEGTDSFLRALPVAPGRLVLPKVATALAAMALLAIVLAASTAVLAVALVAAQSISLDDLLTLVVRFGLTPLEVFAWGLLFSLVTRRTLVAGCLGAAGASLAIHLSARIVAPDAMLLSNLQPYGQSVFPYRIGFLALVISADVWLGRRWPALSPLEDWYTSWRSSRPQVSPTYVEEDLTSLRRRPSQYVALRHLTWQAFRASRAPMWAMLGVGTLALLTLALMYDAPDDRLKWAVAVILSVVTMMGSFVFLADHQREQFRYFAERPARPRLVWLSRHVAWLSLIGVWMGVMTPIWIAVVFHGDMGSLTSYPLERSYPTVSMSFAGRLNQMPGWLTITLFMWLAYSAGQVGSMFVRSGVLAAVLGVVIAGLVAVWVAIMEWVGVSWLLSAAPIPIIALFVTWRRMPDLIIERNGWRAWLRVVVSIALPIVAMLSAMGYFRVTTIPLVPPPFSAAEYYAKVTSEARETGDLYLRGGERVTGIMDFAIHNHEAVPFTPGDTPYDTSAQRAAVYDRDFATWRSWVAQNQHSIGLFVQASERADCSLPLSFAFNGIARYHLQNGLRLLTWDALALTRDGDLGAAFARLLTALRMAAHLNEGQISDSSFFIVRDVCAQFIDWSAAPGQSPERIRKAIEALSQWEGSLPPADDSIKAHYVWVSDMLSADPARRDRAVAQTRFDENERANELAMQLLPWERVRAQRVLDLLTAGSLQNVQSLTSALAAGEPMTIRFMRALHRYDSAANAWLNSTPILQRVGPYSYLFEDRDFVWRLQSRTLLPATQIQMALIGWRLEHGELPDSLEQLVGSYFERLPRDRFTGQNYVYLPNGSPKPLIIDSNGVRVELPPGTPLLWSPARRLVPIPESYAKEDRRYRMVLIGHPYEQREVGDPISEIDALQSGHIMPIPRPQ